MLASEFLIKKKFRNKYKGSYRKGGKTISVSTNISRVRGKNEMSDNDKMEFINGFNTKRVCILSCSFLSKEIIKKEFYKMQDEKVSGNIYQLFWIISSFIHACRGAGVIPRIYCQV